MKVQDCRAVEAKPVNMEGASGCQVRWLVGNAEDAPNFAMREFEVAPGGHTPRHSHPYEHEVFILDGEGEVYKDDQAFPLRKNTVVYVAPDEVHQFRNTGGAPLRFLCLVPNSYASAKVTVAPECGVEMKT